MWTSSDKLTIQQYHQLVQGATQHLTSRVIWKSSLSEKQHTTMQHFSGACLTSGSRVQWLCPCALSVQTVSVYKGEDSAQFTNRHHQAHGKWSNVFPGGMMVRGQLSKKETQPGRTATPKQERGSPRHPQGSKQIFSLVNSAHRVSNCENIQKCQGHMTILCAMGTWHFSSARGMNFHLKTMRPHHQCWTPPSQVWLALFYSCNPTCNWNWGTAFRLHLWFTPFNSLSFVIFSNNMFSIWVIYFEYVMYLMFKDLVISLAYGCCDNQWIFLIQKHKHLCNIYPFPLQCPPHPQQLSWWLKIEFQMMK